MIINWRASEERVTEGNPSEIFGLLVKIVDGESIAQNFEVQLLRQKCPPRWESYFLNILKIK